jgi:hypothetical protein
VIPCMSQCRRGACPTPPYCAAASARDRSKHARHGRGDNHCTGDVPFATQPRDVDKILVGSSARPRTCWRTPGIRPRITRSRCCAGIRQSVLPPPTAAKGKISLINGPDSANAAPAIAEADRPVHPHQTMKLRRSTACPPRRMMGYCTRLWDLRKWLFNSRRQPTHNTDDACRDRQIRGRESDSWSFSLP